MRYARYDFKRKNNDTAKFLFVSVIVLALAFIIGSIISQIIFKGGKIDGISSLISTKTTNNISIPQKNTIIKYIAIQGGLCKQKEHADEIKNTLSAYGNPFIITEQDKSMRIFLGIFNEGEADKNIKVLTDKKIDNCKVVFELNKADLCDAEIKEIIDGYLLILSAMASDDKTISATSFKKYCSTELKDVSKSSVHYVELNELKNYVENIPENFTKANAADNYTKIYNILKQLQPNKSTS